MKVNITLFTAVACCSTLFAETKVACVGDSITFGAGVAARERLSYPKQLGYLLGKDYEVKNFGVGGRTMLSKGDHPYIKEKAYQESLTFNPDVVILKLGTNDSKPHNWKFKADFNKDTKALIESYQKLPSKPRVILCKPVVVVKDRWGITEKVTRAEVAQEIEKVAFETGVEIVDLHPILLDKKKHVPDGVHPNAFGAEIMAGHLYRYLTTGKAEKTVELPKGETFSFYGFTGVYRDDEGLKIVSPRKAAKGNPWVWRARFWNHEPQFDITMLELGWHVVYCDVADLFGSPQAIQRWEKAYAYTQTMGLAKKPVLEGMSRGGLPIHKWALKHPDKTAGIIGDNCVMDVKSWPAGFASSDGGVAAWEKCKAAYGFKTDEEAKAYKENPVDFIEKIAEKNIPLLYLIADNDKIVPHNENSGLAVKKLGDYKHLQVIKKSGMGHHPHSLPNPAPIVDFALKCNETYVNPAIVAKPSAEFRGGPAGWGGGIWFDQHEKINKLASENKDLELVFLGDSISQSWTGSHKRLSQKGGKRPFDRYFGEKWKSASFGISGDRTEHLLYRIQNGNFDEIQPKVVVVMIGVNNVLGGGHNGDQIAEGIKKVTEALHKKVPNLKILLLGPLPAGKTPQDKRRVELEKAHAIIKDLDGKNNVTYLNLKSTFIDKEGKVIPKQMSGDFIHLKRGGYEAWAKALMPHLEKLMK